MMERLRELWTEERDQDAGRELAAELIRLGDPLAGVRVLVELGDEDIWFGKYGGPYAPSLLMDNYRGLTEETPLLHATTGIELRWRGPWEIDLHPDSAGQPVWWELWAADLLERLNSQVEWGRLRAEQNIDLDDIAALESAPNIIRRRATRLGNETAPEILASESVAAAAKIKNLDDAMLEGRRQILNRSHWTGIPISEELLYPALWVAHYAADIALVALGAKRPSVGSATRHKYVAASIVWDFSQGMGAVDGHWTEGPYGDDSYNPNFRIVRDEREWALQHLMDVATGRVDPRTS